MSTQARLHPFQDAQTQFKRGFKDKLKVVKHLGKGIRNVWEGFGKLFVTFWSNFGLGKIFLIEILSIKILKLIYNFQ